VTALPVKSLYTRLQEYYDNNDLYEATQAYSHEQGKWVEAIKPLKTCVNRSVEFYVSRLCKDKVVVTAEDEAVEEAVEQFLKWSNFESKKRPYVRSMALLGDLFLKVVSNPSKVYAEMVDPSHVTSFSVDYRGYIQEIRIDIPMKDDHDQPYTYTETWNKEYFSSWNHHYTDSTPLEDLGTPSQFVYLAQMGIDFVPIVWIPFKQVNGKDRGESCVGHALAKIDEVNRITTRLHQILWRYNKPLWVVSANAVDKNNRPLPAPVVKGKSAGEERDLDLLAQELIYLPGMSSMSSLIPDIDYNAALAIVKAMEEELEKDLPELRYYSLNDTQNSGKALKILLAPSIDRAEEAKSNLIAGIKRLNEMALTVGKFMGLFPSIGTYEKGEYEHSLDFGDVFPQDNDDKAATLKTLAEAGVPLETAMKLAGFDESTIAEAVEAKRAQEERAMGSFLTEFNKG